MYKPITILSKNKKTGASLNLPIKGHCHPTPNCLHDCYAKCGPIAMPRSTRKQRFVSNYLINKELDELIKETLKFSQLRLCGSGDLLPAHVPALLSLAKACPDTMLWGMTRKPDIAYEVNDKHRNLKILVTVDASSPSKTWNYDGAMCYGPKRPGDYIPRDSRLITIFPRHFRGKVVAGVERHPKDCLAVWHEITGCNSCGRCWKWSKK
jgi:hypothetical protein